MYDVYHVIILNKTACNIKSYECSMLLERDFRFFFFFFKTRSVTDSFHCCGNSFKFQVANIPRGYKFMYL